MYYNINDYNVIDFCKDFLIDYLENGKNGIWIVQPAGCYSKPCIGVNKDQYIKLLEVIKKLIDDKIKLLQQEA